MRICLEHIGIGQTESALIGVSSIFAGCLVAVAVSKLSEYITGKFSTIIMTMYAGATFFFLWFALMYEKWLPISTISVYACCICGSALLNGTIPLFYELAIETVFNRRGSTWFFNIIAKSVTKCIFILFQLIDLVCHGWSGVCGWLFFYLLYLSPLGLKRNIDEETRRVL